MTNAIGGFPRNIPPLPRGEPIHARQMWAANRFWMETQNLVTKRYGGKRKQHWYALLFLLKVFERSLRMCGQFQRGLRNAEDLVLRELEVRFEALPAAFDGFTILHLSDPQSEHRAERLDHLADHVVERVLPALGLREPGHLVAQELANARRVTDRQALEFDRVRSSPHGFLLQSEVNP
jgi:hypothetical protein